LLNEVLLQELALDELSEEPLMTTLASKPLAYEPQDPLAKDFIITLGSRGGIAMIKAWGLPSWLVG
jgi:hypothetical protein